MQGSVYGPMSSQLHYNHHLRTTIRDKIANGSDFYSRVEVGILTTTDSPAMRAVGCMRGTTHKSEEKSER